MVPPKEGKWYRRWGVTKPLIILVFSGIALGVIFSIQNPTIETVPVPVYNTNGEEKDSDEESITAVEDEGSGNNGEDRTNLESAAYEEYQKCVSDAEEENGFFIEQETQQQCYESSFGEDRIIHVRTDNAEDISRQDAED